MNQRLAVAESELQSQYQLVESTKQESIIQHARIEELESELQKERDSRNGTESLSTALKQMEEVSSREKRDLLDVIERTQAEKQSVQGERITLLFRTCSLTSVNMKRITLVPQRTSYGTPNFPLNPRGFTSRNLNSFSHLTPSRTDSLLQHQFSRGIQDLSQRRTRKLSNRSHYISARETRGVDYPTKSTRIEIARGYYRFEQFG